MNNLETATNTLHCAILTTAATQTLNTAETTATMKKRATEAETRAAEIAAKLRENKETHDYLRHNFDEACGHANKFLQEWPATWVFGNVEWNVRHKIRTWAIENLNN